MSLNIEMHQHIASQLEQFLASGGQIQQLAPDVAQGYNGDFNNAIRKDLSGIRESARQYETVAERRTLILSFIRNNPKSTCMGIAAKLRIWHGHVAADIKYLRRDSKVIQQKIYGIYYYSASVAAAKAVQLCE